VVGARGGQGTTTIACVVALLEADHQPTTLVTADPAATAALLGLPIDMSDEPTEITSGLRLGSAVPDRSGALVVDSGPALRSVTARLGQRYAVLRGPCYVAVATLVAVEEPFDGIILVAEEGRSLTADDIHDVVGIPVVATIPSRARVARTIDAGLLISRLPRLREFDQLRALSGPREPDRALSESHTELLLPKIGRSHPAGKPGAVTEILLAVVDRAEGERLGRGQAPAPHFSSTSTGSCVRRRRGSTRSACVRRPRGSGGTRPRPDDRIGRRSAARTEASGGASVAEDEQQPDDVSARIPAAIRGW
jgi:hypothetical protein